MPLVVFSLPRYCNRGIVFGQTEFGRPAKKPPASQFGNHKTLKSDRNKARGTMNVTGNVGQVTEANVSVVLVYQKYDAKKENDFSATQANSNHVANARMQVYISPGGAYHVKLRSVLHCICEFVQKSNCK
jgi:hypothetical protein